MTFVSVVQSAGGSDWDTFADGIYFDIAFDTGRADEPTVFPQNTTQQIVVAQSGSVTWDPTKWIRSRVISYPSQYPSSTKNFLYSMDTNYNPSPAAIEADYPPFIAVWHEFPDLRQYGGNNYSRGWVVLQREDPLYTHNSSSIVYNVVYSIDGPNEGMASSTKSVVKVGLTEYDGNAANWRDFDGWTKVQEQDWEITAKPATGTWSATITNNYAAKNIVASGNSFPQGFWRNGNPRLVCGTEAVNYGATAGAFGAANQAQFATSAEAQLYFRRYAYFQEIVGATYTIPVFGIGGSQPSYNNCGSTLGSGQTLNVGDVVRLHIFEW